MCPVLRAARSVGVADRIGILEVRKDAGAVALSANSFDYRITVDPVWCDGEVMQIRGAEA
jgi:imidazolonepropionase-like amidohydrolase